MLVEFACIDCGNKGKITLNSILQKRFRSLCRSCSILKVGHKGKNHYNWKGGRIRKVEGYIEIYAPDHPLASKNRRYVYEHRIVAAEKYGVFAVMESHVHHIDGNRENNNPDNLELVRDNPHHWDKHRDPNSNRRRYNEANSLIYCKCGCKSEFLKYDQGGRQREFLIGHFNKWKKSKQPKMVNINDMKDTF